MKKIVFNAPEGWRVTEEVRSVEEDEFGTLERVQEIHIIPDGGSMATRIDLNFYPDDAPGSSQEAKEVTQQNLQKFLDRTLPEFYQAHFSGELLLSVGDGERKAWYYVSQEPGERSATIEFTLDILPDHYIVFGSVEVKSTLYELESIMRDVVGRVSLQDA